VHEQHCGMVPQEGCGARPGEQLHIYAMQCPWLRVDVPAVGRCGTVTLMLPGTNALNATGNYDDEMAVGEQSDGGHKQSVIRRINTFSFQKWPRVYLQFQLSFMSAHWVGF